MTDIEDSAEGDVAASPDAQGNGVSSMDLAEISALRSSDKRQYYSSAVQGRELELLEAQPPDTANKLWWKPEETAPEKTAEVRPWWETQDTPQEQGAELATVADLPVDLQPAGEFATGVLAEDAMSSETFEAFTSELSETAQDALLEKLGQSADMDAEPATDEQLAEFTSTAEGEAMVEEWGDEAAEKLGIVSLRYMRLRNAMPSHERETFDELFDELPPAAIEEVYRRLTQ